MSWKLSFFLFGLILLFECRKKNMYSDKEGKSERESERALVSVSMSVLQPDSKLAI